MVNHRHNLDGLSVDFWCSLAGFLFYIMCTCTLIWSSEAHAQFRTRVGSQAPPSTADVAFALHSLALTAATLLQTGFHMAQFTFSSTPVIQLSDCAIFPHSLCIKRNLQTRVTCCSSFRSFTSRSYRCIGFELRATACRFDDRWGCLPLIRESRESDVGIDKAWPRL
ncbi:hypothetical protein BJ741DRAFT_597791 [Chytriomyces cf. hyalinus JEL632]|nr:hypothetical protein BJ741DRAFT_597791 [Chytriomyces cf. hyalinus JEL632]